MPGLCSKYDSTSLYFSVKVLLIQQIGSIRVIIKGRGPGIFSCYYKHDPQLPSQENRGKIELKEFNSCLIPHLLLMYLTSNLKSQRQLPCFHQKIPTRKYFSYVPAHSRPHWICWKNNEKNNNNRSYSCTLYVHVYASGLSLSFEASIANEDSSVTSRQNLQWHLSQP